MLLRSKLFYCLRLHINPMLGEGDQNAMLGVNALRSKLFYFLRLPIHPKLGGGDQNASLGVIKVLGVNAASQQTFLLSPAPHLSNARGR